MYLLNVLLSIVPTFLQHSGIRQPIPG